MIKLFNSNRDEVIKSTVAQAATTYRYALDHIYPLINKFEEQRKVQRRKFYERLETDILRGCLMPPITLAFINNRLSSTTDQVDISKYINANIGDGYVIDGMQRLTTLLSASEKEGFQDDRPLYVNVIVAERYDLLLYRMITLNNGQKPMTARHQIEMLTKGLIDTDSLNISILSEKDTEQAKIPGAFKRADVSAAYTAFLTNSVNNDNSRIIESKLDEILVGKVMEANLSESNVTFSRILRVIDKFSANIDARDWLRLGNNLIGFSVGARASMASLEELSADEFGAAVKIFDQAFRSIDVSKINVGKIRRELARTFTAKITDFANAEIDTIVEAFFEETMIN
jgi:hypothetical protein